MTIEIDWGDPAARATLAERVGTSEYNRLIQAHFATMTVDTVNGYRIRAVNSGRWGRLYMVDGAGVAFATVEGAQQRAAELPTREALESTELPRTPA